MQLTGVIPALVTPFTSAGKLDLMALNQLIEQLRAAKVSGWVACGSTGEYNVLTKSERIAVMQQVADVAQPDELLIAGVNAGSTQQVIELTAIAAEYGYAAILLSPPYFAMPDQDELLQHFTTIIQATKLPVILYNYPQKLGVEIGLPVLEKLLQHENLVGIKDSSGDIQRATEFYCKFRDRLDLVCGSDATALDLFWWGANSWICGPANFLAASCVNMVKAHQDGNYQQARELMARMFPVLSSLESSKFVQKVKYGSKLVGCPVGDCRSPLQPLTPKEQQQFRQLMQPFIPTTVATN